MGPMSAKKLILLIFALLVLLILSACSPGQASTPTLSPTPTLIPPSPTSVMGCTAITAEPTPSASSALPPITSVDYVSGSDSALVTMVFYCDFQSAQCQVFSDVLDQLQKDHPNDLRVAFRPVPATGVLDKSQISVQAAIAAGNQNKFWEMRAILHSKYGDWINLSINQFESWVEVQASGLGLDTKKFNADLKSSDTIARTKSLYNAAIQLGISGIPTVFINGSLQLRPALSYSGLESTISLIALGAHEFKSCPPFSIDTTRQYTATIHLDKGDILIQLYADKAPLAVNSFVFLAKNGWFNGVTFHRVIPGFVAQAGDPSGTGLGGPGYFFKNEINADLQYNKPGMVGMANSGTDTNGSQFFITYAPAPTLDGAYTIFGQVLKGMDVVESLTPRDPSQTSNLPPGDKIISVTVVEK
jgi:cyclophilin family peptidyl-prolyl cis-trans isomerase/predicted DsbA family dithiol-disulfide isomerase